MIGSYNTIRILLLQIHNRNKGCYLMRKFKAGSWTLPALIIPIGADPVNHINIALKQIAGDFELMSALNIMDFTRVGAFGVTFRASVYRVNLKGVISPQLPEGCADYEKSQWMPIEAVKRHPDLTVPTHVFANAVASYQELK